MFLMKWNKFYIPKYANVMRAPINSTPSWKYFTFMLLGSHRVYHSSAVRRAWLASAVGFLEKTSPKCPWLQPHEKTPFETTAKLSITLLTTIKCNIALFYICWFNFIFKTFIHHCNESGIQPKQNKNTQIYILHFPLFFYIAE